MDGELEAYIVVTQDTVIQSREYVVYAKDGDDARRRVAKGQFLVESAATTMDTVRTVVVKIDKVNPK